ncbi:MAG: hypothetical protein ABIE23_02440 [archaeon]
MKKVFVFGNPLLEKDSIALKAGKELEKELKGMEFYFIHEPEEMDELSEREWKELVILDAVEGIKEVRIIPLEKLVKERKVTAHDLDLGFYLQLKKKLGELKEVKIIGIPMEMKKEKAVEETRKLLKKSI